jgi:hypothetical protein
MDVRTPHRALIALLLALALLPAAAASAADTGAAGPAFTGVTAPSGEKPQSKLWFNDGAWWAVLYRPSTTSYEVFKDTGGTWTPTGTVIDTRHSVYVDAQWDGTHLNVVSAGMSAALGVRYSRYAYSAGGYTRDVGPVALTDFGVEAAVLDRDGAGTLWVTYTHDRQVYVAHSTTDDATWTAPFVLPGSATVTADDISAIVRYPGHIGVMYSNQDPAVWEFTWASHADGAADTDWQLSTALKGAELSDDHINLKALDGDPAGQVFAAVKTSLNASSDPLIKLLVLDNAGTWHDYDVFTVGDEPTRPQVELDPLRREVHVFAALGPCCTGGIVTVKTANLDAISFAGGAGTTLLSSGDNPKLNNVALTKQPISADMPFLPVLAGDDSTKRYWFGTLGLSANPPAPKPSSPAASGGTPTASAGATPLPVGAGTPATQNSTLVPAQITRLGVLPTAFRRRGTATYRLTHRTQVVVRIERRGPRGTWVLARRYLRTGRAGTNTLTIRARGLRSGRYRILLGVRGRHAVSASFRIGR